MGGRSAFKCKAFLGPIGNDYNQFKLKTLSHPCLTIISPPCHLIVNRASQIENSSLYLATNSIESVFVAYLFLSLSQVPNVPFEFIKSAKLQTWQNPTRDREREGEGKGCFLTQNQEKRLSDGISGCLFISFFFFFFFQGRSGRDRRKHKKPSLTFGSETGSGI